MIDFDDLQELGSTPCTPNAFTSSLAASATAHASAHATLATKIKVIASSLTLGAAVTIAAVVHYAYQITQPNSLTSATSTQRESAEERMTTSSPSLSTSKGANTSPSSSASQISQLSQVVAADGRGQVELVFSNDTQPSLSVSPRAESNSSPISTPFPVPTPSALPSYRPSPSDSAAPKPTPSPSSELPSPNPSSDHGESFIPSTAPTIAPKPTATSIPDESPSTGTDHDKNTPSPSDKPSTVPVCTAKDLTVLSSEWRIEGDHHLEASITYRSESRCRLESRATWLLHFSNGSTEQMSSEKIAYDLAPGQEFTIKARSDLVSYIDPQTTKVNITIGQIGNWMINHLTDGK